jgi:hypothetical protein
VIGSFQNAVELIGSPIKEALTVPFKVVRLVPVGLIIEVCARKNNRVSADEAPGALKVQCPLADLARLAPMVGHRPALAKVHPEEIGSSPDTP